MIALLPGGSTLAGRRDWVRQPAALILPRVCSLYLQQGGEQLHVPVQHAPAWLLAACNLAVGCVMGCHLSCRRVLMRLYPGAFSRGAAASRALGPPCIYLRGPLCSRSSDRTPYVRRLAPWGAPCVLCLCAWGGCARPDRGCRWGGSSRRLRVETEAWRRVGADHATERVITVCSTPPGDLCEASCRRRAVNTRSAGSQIAAVCFVPWQEPPAAGRIGMSTL